jgi:hypothetical protein
MIKMEKENQIYHKAKIVEEIVRFLKKGFILFQNLSFEQKIFYVEDYGVFKLNKVRRVLK